MPIWKLQCTIGGDTALPRDRAVITPHFNDGGIGTNPDGLCEDLATALSTYFPGAGSREIIVKAYDAQGTVPVYPQGEAIRNANVNPLSTAVREVALCLSFFSVRNIPRQRGRLYLPVYALGAATASARPPSATMTKVMALGPILAGLGGPDVDWVVFSKSDGVARPVTNYWVDDEWDTIRSRGLTPTTRQVATTTEL